MDMSHKTVLRYSYLDHKFPIYRDTCFHSLENGTSYVLFALLVPIPNSGGDVVVQEHDGLQTGGMYYRLTVWLNIIFHYIMWCNLTNRVLYARKIDIKRLE